MTDPKTVSKRWHVWRVLAHEQPPKTGWYLVSARTADPKQPLKQVAFWGADEQRFSGLVQFWIDRLTHWMPLPPNPVWSRRQPTEDKDA